MPVRFGLDLVVKGTTIKNWGALVCRRDTTLMVHIEFMHLQAVVATDILAEGRWRRSMSLVHLDATTSTRTSINILRLILICAINYNGLTIATCVVLRWRHVHLVLVLATRLNHAGRLPDNLLIRHVRIGATRKLRAVSQTQVELACI